MRLKKLELVGFKSFADRTEVFFDKGVTCVVGPNGCGKSNISDSIRWVLGERSAKILRGAKMEDVIFAGTQFRKPVAFAEVSLTIDNRDRGLPIDYNEVTITRRLHRTGESEYLLNKTACRLKDIQDLILDTGIGSSSYSMIEQGRIDYILNASSDERRFLIEEAAGISKYKVKKEEALRKLDRTEQNLLRLRDIVAEVQRNIQYAERQAKRAQKYQEQFERLKELEVKKAFLDLSHIDTETASLEAYRQEQEQKIEEFNAVLRQVRTEQENLSASLKEILERLAAEESNRYAIKGQIDQNEQQLRFNQEKKVTFATRRGEIHQEQSQLQEQRVKTAAELEMKKREADSIEDHRGTAEEMFQAARKMLEQAESHLDSVKLVFNETKNAALEASSESARLRNDYHRVCAFLESSTEQKKKQDAGADRYQKELNQWVARKEDCDKSLQVLETRLEEIVRTKAHAEDHRENLRQSLQETTERIESAERLLHEKETRRQLLEEIDASAGVEQVKILQELTEEERALLKSIREVLHVNEGYEWAVEAVLGDFARALIADHEALGVKLLDKMSEKGSAPAGFFIKSPSVEPAASAEFERPSHRLITARLDEVVSVEPGYRDLILPFFERSYVLERLEPSSLNEVLGVAEHIRLVTREGTIIGPHRRIYFRQGQLISEQSFFKRGSEIEALIQEAAAFTTELENSRRKEAEIRQELSETESSIQRVDADYMEAKLQRESFESLRKGLQERLGTYQRELELIFTERQETQSKEEDAVTQRTHLEMEIMRTEERQRRIRSEQENLLHDMERLEHTKSQALKEYADHKAKLDNLTERKRYLEEAVELLSSHATRVQERLEVLAQELARIEEKEALLAGEDDEIRQAQERLREEAAAADLRFEKIRQEKESVENEVRILELKLQEAQENKHAAEEALHDSEKKHMELGYQTRNIQERLGQTYKMDLAALNPADYPMSEDDRPQAEAEIEQLSRRIESIGTVNLLAIEEYDELKERYDFLMTQQKDLDDAKTALMEAIKKINRTTKGLFESTFDQVHKAFKSYYETLFRGGEARLILVDEANPLESGVDIVVRPPGKKLQHISLMSGGEKAMTALALLFSLFSIKPSPFCVLDEVDAPLDEANVDRFITVVKPFLQMTQFIIVTHNRKTIAMGDALYGVTMQEAGVSKIVSVKMAQDARDEAFEESEEESASEEMTQEVRTGEASGDEGMTLTEEL